MYDSPLLRKPSVHTQTYTSRKAADRRLERDIAAVLLVRNIPDLERLRIEARDGKVLLRGTVRSPFQKKLIATAVGSIKGVIHVVDELKAEPARVETFTERFNIRYGVIASIAASLLVVVLVALYSKESRLPVFPVAGKLLLNNTVAPGAQVIFFPKDGHPDAPRPQGTVDQHGNFTLTTYEPGDGAPLGDYLVTVRWQKVVGKGEDARAVEIIAPEYRSPRTTNLKALIAEQAANRVMLSLQTSRRRSAYGRR